MTQVLHIPLIPLAQFVLKPGDTLRNLSQEVEWYQVLATTGDAPKLSAGKAAEWLRSARGIVRLALGETVVSVRDVRDRSKVQRISNNR